MTHLFFCSLVLLMFAVRYLFFVSVQYKNVNRATDQLKTQYQGLYSIKKLLTLKSLTNEKFTRNVS